MIRLIMTLKFAVIEVFILLLLLLTLYKSNLGVGEQTVNSRLKIIEKKYYIGVFGKYKNIILYYYIISILKLWSAIPNMLSVFGIVIMLAL